MDDLRHGALTGEIINAFYQVYNTLGYGFLEKVYENALGNELRKRGFHVLQQHPINVFYQDSIVGEYFADLVINDQVIVEVKAASAISATHEAQLLNYLRATDIEVGLVVNFGIKPQFRRKILTRTGQEFNKEISENPR